MTITELYNYISFGSSLHGSILSCTLTVGVGIDAVVLYYSTTLTTLLHLGISKTLARAKDWRLTSEPDWMWTMDHRYRATGTGLSKPVAAPAMAKCNQFATSSNRTYMNNLPKQEYCEVSFAMFLFWRCRPSVSGLIMVLLITPCIRTTTHHQQQTVQMDNNDKKLKHDSKTSPMALKVHAGLIWLRRPPTQDPALCIPNTPHPEVKRPTWSPDIVCGAQTSHVGPTPAQLCSPTHGLNTSPTPSPCASPQAQHSMWEANIARAVHPSMLGYVPMPAHEPKHPTPSPSASTQALAPHPEPKHLNPSPSTPPRAQAPQPKPTPSLNIAHGMQTLHFAPSLRLPKSCTLSANIVHGATLACQRICELAACDAAVDYICYHDFLLHLVITSGL
ncbi:hypothetical protein BU15DRAFT_65360 [Melanogaster broomeanus]|nr:hypothetical protein BU15DRAFT_65360 [Melanogaster broomeanus]